MQANAMNEDISDAMNELREYYLGELDKKDAEIEQLRAGLQQIESWSRAYPLEMFPEPDFEKAHKLLQAGGMPLDAISAAAMRHVVEGVGAIARRALEEKT